MQDDLISEQCSLLGTGFVASRVLEGDARAILGDYRRVLIQKILVDCLAPSAAASMSGEQQTHQPGQDSIHSRQALQLLERYTPVN